MTLLYIPSELIIFIKVIGAILVLFLICLGAVGLCQLVGEIRESVRLGLPSFDTPQWKFVESRNPPEFIGNPSAEVVRAAMRRHQLWPVTRWRSYRRVYLSELLHLWWSSYIFMLIVAASVALSKVILWAVTL